MDEVVSFMLVNLPPGKKTLAHNREAAGWVAEPTWTLRRKGKSVGHPTYSLVTIPSEVS
jgi:hypothetical protein